MLIQNFQEYFKKLFSGQQSKKIKILSTLSIGWIILLGYLRIKMTIMKKIILLLMQHMTIFVLN